MYYQKNSKELVTNHITVGNWYKNPQGTSRFVEVGEGILEASNQENYNNIDNSITTFSHEKSLIRHHFVLSYLLFYHPTKETTCPIGFLGQFYLRKVTCPQSADGVFISKIAFIDHTQIIKIKIHNYAPNTSCISESIRCIA